jgi:hypothetical protein
VLARGTDGTPAAGRWKPWAADREDSPFPVGLILILISGGLNLILISGGLNLILISGGLNLILISGGFDFDFDFDFRWVDFDFPVVKS